MIKTLYVFTDGGAKGNPGPAAIGFLIKDNFGKTLFKDGKSIGCATNNVAEYQAVAEALQWIITNFKQQPLIINFYLDSLLVVNQLNGRFKVKNKNLKNLVIEIKNLEKKINGKIFYHYIPREKNKQVHFLVHNFILG
jgi:ribonuclease HI